MCGIPYFTNKIKKKINKNYMLQENQTNKPNQQQNEERNNREIRTTNREIRKTQEHKNFNRLFRDHQPKQPPETESTRRRGNVECRGQTISHRLNYLRELLEYIYKQTLIDFCLIYVTTPRFHYNSIL